ncbi:MAG: Ig-like domain-containing protein [Deltaproteobacteria bacterium]|nr:Ig-like domain-containing protein [Deltaproteobacteria bacterium]
MTTIPQLIRNRILSVLLLLAFSMLMSACGGGEGNEKTPGVPLPDLIEITPANPSLPLGLTVQLSALVTFPQVPPEDLTAELEWTSNNESVALVQDKGDASPGLVQSVATGEATITATHAASGVSAQTLVTVTDAALAAITSVSPANPSLPLGVDQQFTATGDLTDGSTGVDVTLLVDWSATAVDGSATITSGGLATPVAEGDVTITAADPAGVLASASTTLTVLPAALAAIQVTPASAILTIGQSQQFTATGDLTDGTTGVDVTATVTWSSSDASVTMSVATPGQADTSSWATGVTITAQAAAWDGGTISGTASLDAMAPPEIYDVSPAAGCAGALTLNISGNDISPTATVELKNGVDTITATSATLVNASLLEAAFADVPAGDWEVTVINAPGMTSFQLLTVDPLPGVFWVSQPVVSQSINTPLELTLMDVVGGMTSLEVVDSGGTATSLSFTYPAAQQAQAVAPAGLTADSYDLRVTTGNGCVGLVPQALVVSDALTLDLTSVSPTYISPTAATELLIQAANPAGAGLVNFSAVPGAYLVPVGFPEGAVLLGDLKYLSPGWMTARVPGGLSLGDYDLVVVNPDGTTGVLLAAVSVLAQEPPAITKVVPGNLVANSVNTITVEGTGFDTLDIAAEVFCIDSFGTPATMYATSISGNATQLSMSVDASGQLSGMSCQLAVINSDGGRGEYHNLSVSSPIGLISDWAPGPDLLTPRRNPGLVTVPNSDGTAWLYAVAGDTGTVSDSEAPGTVLATVESAFIGKHGVIGGFLSEAGTLPQGITGHGTVAIGDFIYTAGGLNSAGVVQTAVYRAQVQKSSPIETVTVRAQPGDGVNGLGAGRWHYTVASYYPSSHAPNPSGVSLPGEAAQIVLPNDPQLAQVRLTWSQDPDAEGYRIYRTSTADSGQGSMGFLADVVGGAVVTYLDTGGVVVPEVVPMVEGSLGVWHRPDDTGASAASLVTPREGATVFAAPDPDTAGAFFLYACGGRDEISTVLDSCEYSEVIVGADGSQTLSAFTLSSQVLNAARADLGAWVLTNDDMSIVPAGEVRVYLAGGTNGTSVTMAETFQVGNSGDMTAAPVVLANSGNAHGYGTFKNWMSMFLYGGINGVASNNGRSAELHPSNYPQLDTGAWNLTGIPLIYSRIFAGAAELPGLAVMAGGHDGFNTISTVEITIK